MRAALRLLGGYRPQGVILAPNTGSPLPAPTTLGTHIGDYMRQPGDQIITLADDTYDGASIDAAASQHPHTSGQYGGWLIIQAQTQHGAVVDLSSTGFNVGGTVNHFAVGFGNATYRNLRIMFVGVKFVNGALYLPSCRNVRFWGCDFTFPAHQWNLQYVAAGGDNASVVLNNSVVNGMANPTSQTIRVDDVGSGPFSVNWCDFHNIGEDGIFDSSYATWEVVGNRFWDIYHHNIPKASAYSDDGVNYLNPVNGLTCMHSDCFQSEGGSNITFTDNQACGHLELTSANTSLSVVINRIWTFGCEGNGASLTELNGNSTNGSVDNVLWDANGQYAGGTGAHPAHSQVNDNGWNGEHFPDPSHFTVGTITRGLPSGVTKTNGLLDDLTGPNFPDIPSITNHAANPANLWRAAHPYSSWATYFSGNWP